MYVSIIEALLLLLFSVWIQSFHQPFGVLW